MAHVLTDAVKTELRFAANYRTQKDFLLQLDPKRFRGLGDTHSKAFVREAFAFSDHNELHYMEEVEYIIFLMSFLGTYFYQDPRYFWLAQVLQDKTRPSDARLNECQRRFARFSDRFIGDDLTIFQGALAQFWAGSETISTSDKPMQKTLEVFYKAYNFSLSERQAFPEDEIMSAAYMAARSLGVQTTTGNALCFSLSLWMGTGFYRDPLFPWVRDIVAAAGDSVLQRERELTAYAKKRLRPIIVDKE